MATKKAAAPATFATRLKVLREGAGLSQAELATALGTSVMTVSKLETGERSDPRWSTVCKLADALGVAVGAFRSVPPK